MAAGPKGIRLTVTNKPKTIRYVIHAMLNIGMCVWVNNNLEPRDNPIVRTRKAKIRSANFSFFCKLIIFRSEIPLERTAVTGFAIVLSKTFI
jgi:hypothetical protein